MGQNKRDCKSFIHPIRVICGLFSLLLGVAVLTSWHLHIEEIITVKDGYVPMQYNTALCFALLGVGLITYRKSFLTCHLSCIAASIIAFLTINEYATGVDFGIDEMFFDHYITTQTPNAGRMAINTALCFTLLGSSIGYLDSPLMRRFLSFVCIGISGVAVAGYAMEHVEFYLWNPTQTAMALHSAVGFLVLSVGVFCMNGFSHHAFKMFHRGYYH